LIRQVKIILLSIGILVAITAIIILYFGETKPLGVEVGALLELYEVPKKEPLQNLPDPAFGYKYELVWVKVSNPTGKKLSAGTEDFSLLTESGSSYPFSNKQAYLPDTFPTLFDVLPNTNISGVLLFEIPKSEKPAYIIFQRIKIPLPTPLTYSPEPTSTPSPTTVPPPTTPEPEPIEFQGTGQKVTTSFYLHKGIAIFRMHHYGSSNFIIWLYNADTGERVELLVNVIGTFHGATIVGVTGEPLQASPGNYILEITADGSWTIKIEQPHPTSASKPPLTFTGEGTRVSPPFMLESGIATFYMKHYGSGNFIIWLYDSEGHRVELLVNEIGPFEGSTIVGVTGQLFEASPGIHYLAITADGKWKIVVTQG